MTCGFDEQNKVYKEFVNIRTANELRAFLDNRAMRHDRISHYTKWESAHKILKSHTIWFTRADLLNDAVEGIRASKEEKSKTYIASFSHELQENLEEWVLYGDSGNGLRLSSTNSSWIQGIVRSKKAKKVGDYCDEESIVDFDIISSDVIYYDDSDNSIVLYYDDCKNIVFEKDGFEELCNELPFVFKPAIWKYEHETRLIVSLKEALDCKKIALGFSPEIVLNLTMGPMINKTINDYAHSQYEGIIKLPQK